MTGNLDNLIAIAEEVTASLGLIRVDTRFAQQGKRKSLRITIYRPNGQISIEDCEQVSRHLNEILDDRDPPVIHGSYVLEVESPGLDRQLKTEREFSVFSGQRVSVQSQEKLDGLGSHFVGTLKGLDNGKITLTDLHPVLTASKKRKKDSIPAHRGELELDLKALVHVRLQPFEAENTYTSN
jgi:ribosome maturation factor RimP